MNRARIRPSHTFFTQRTTLNIQYLALALIFSTIGVLSSCNPAPPNTGPQNVIVFINGMNTSIDSNCNESSFSQLIHSYIMKEIGVANPYAQGCNAQSQSYLNSTSSMIYFSYQGGSMDSHGVWIPKPYGPCDANNHSITDDVNNFSTMLTTYQKVFPKATFTIIGHSLGGLVALQGAYNYAIVQHHTSINKVITVDSPLEGIFVTPQANNWSSLSSSFCNQGSGNVIFSDLQPLGKVSFVSPVCVPKQGEPTIQAPLVLSQCAARALSQANVGVVTLGNDKDALFCQSGWVFLIGQSTEKSCDTQLLRSETTTFARMYDYSTPYPTAHPSDSDKLAHDHSTLLVTPSVEQDITRYILAPSISVTQPSSGSSAWFNGTGTPVHFSATLHCAWGPVNHAEAALTLQDNTTISAGVFQPNSSSYMLKLTGTVTIPSSNQSTSAMFYVKAGGSACSYPHTVAATMFPTDSDYLFGESHGSPFFLDGGKLALGTQGHLYAARPTANLVSTSSLSYSSYNSDNNFYNSIQDVAWSPDGTRLAYLVQASTDQNGNPLYDLYSVSSTLSQPEKLLASLSGDIAITWNSTNNQIALLEENIPLITTSPDFHFQPTIVIINVPSKTTIRQITLPLRTATSTFFCSFTCYHGRSRIQWGANGVFLISNSESGSMLVTPQGQTTDMATVPPGGIFGPEEAPTGALNTQGTLVVYPMSNTTAKSVTVMLSQVNSSTGKLENPTTLATFPFTSSIQKVDFSPDGTNIGFCADTGVFIINLQQPGNVKTLLHLQGTVDGLLGTGMSLSCEDLRWSANGQAILAQILMTGQAEYGSPVGLVMLPLDGSQPQVLVGCAFTATANGLQVSSNNDPTCIYGTPSVFAWQPTHTS